MKYNIILGSSSPSRAMVLKNTGLVFTQASPDIDETPYEHENPTDLVQRLAREKALAVATQTTPAKPTIIIASDQIALMNTQIVGKPHTLKKAFEILKIASGQTIRFYNGLSLFNTHTHQQITRLTFTDVVFRSLTDREINDYLRVEQPLKCAGAFKSEGLGAALVKEIISTDPNGLIGLPIIEVFDILRQWQVDPFQLGYLSSDKF